MLVCHVQKKKEKKECRHKVPGSTSTKLLLLLYKANKQKINHGFQIGGKPARTTHDIDRECAAESKGSYRVPYMYTYMRVCVSMCVCMRCRHVGLQSICV